MFNLFCLSTLVPPSWQSTLPRYVNLFVYGMSCPLTLIFVGEGTLTHMASVSQADLIGEHAERVCLLLDVLPGVGQ